MLAENVDEELSEFDLRHFCDGNPVYCYYFRLPALKTGTSIPETTAPPRPPEILRLKAFEKDVSVHKEYDPWQE